MNYFVYSGDALIEYLQRCCQIITSYAQNRHSIVHDLNSESLLNVLYSYYTKKGLISMSSIALQSIYQMGHDYHAKTQQIQKMNDKLAVVKNLFNDDFNTRTTNGSITTNRSITSNITKKSIITSPSGLFFYHLFNIF